jgi:hypothetical protein
MKTADLKSGTVYAIGGGTSRYIKTAGMLLSTTPHRVPYRYAEPGTKFTPQTERPSKYATSNWGLPVATVSAYGNDKTMAQLAKLDPAKIKLQSGKQKVDGVDVYVQVFKAQSFRATWSDWRVQEAAAEKARKQAKLAEEQKRERLQLVEQQLLELCAHLGLPKPTVDTYDYGKVMFYQGTELLVALRKLEARA